MQSVYHVLLPCSWRWRVAAFDLQAMTRGVVHDDHRLRGESWCQLVLYPLLEYPFRSFPHESPSHRLTLNERLKSHSLAETLYPCAAVQNYKALPSICGSLAVFVSVWSQPLLTRIGVGVNPCFIQIENWLVLFSDFFHSTVEGKALLSEVRSLQQSLFAPLSRVSLSKIQGCAALSKLWTC